MAEKKRPPWGSPWSEKEFVDRVGLNLPLVHGGPLLTERELGDELDLSTRQLRELGHRGLPRERVKGSWRYPLYDAWHWYGAYKMLTLQRTRTRGGAVRTLTLLEARQHIMSGHWDDDPEGFVWVPVAFANIPHTKNPELPAVEGPEWPDPVLMRRNLFEFILEKLMAEAAARKPRKTKRAAA